MTGHWYCSFCHDIVFKPAPRGSLFWRGTFCPVCRHNACDWVCAAMDLDLTDKKLNPQRAKMLFARVKAAVKN